VRPATGRIDYNICRVMDAQGLGKARFRKEFSMRLSEDPSLFYKQNGDLTNFIDAQKFSVTRPKFLKVN